MTTFQNGFDHWTPQGQSWTIKTWQRVKADFNQSLPDPPKSIDSHDEEELLDPQVCNVRGCQCAKSLNVPNSVRNI